jgi:G3E family GTPase
LVSLEDLLRQRHFGLSLQPLVPAPQTPHVYESVSLSHEGEVDGELFAEFVEAEVGQFAGRIFRVKGILAVAGLDVRMIVQGVTDSVEVTFGAPWGETARTSRLVVVGFGLERTALTQGFAACTQHAPPRPIPASD